MATRLDSKSIAQVFTEARTRYGWTTQPVSDEQLIELYDLLKFGPTSANSSPARFVWVKSESGKSTLAEAALDSNKAKIMSAPATVVIGYDLDFADNLPFLFPSRGEMMKGMFKNPLLAESTAFRNGSLQGAYLILAARTLGLDCGPMSGFNHDAVDTAFFAGTRIKSNFICGLGYGSDANLFPRNPRLSFAEACRFA